MKVMKNNYLKVGFPLHKSIDKFQDANTDKKSRIHECLRFSMRMCRWAGFFPVEGLENPTITGVRYNLKTFYSIYYFITLLTGSVATVFIVIWLSENDLSVTTVADFIFYATGFSSMIIMAILSRNWPKFVRKVTKIEHYLQEIRTKNKSDKYCNIMASMLMIAALVEHILSVIFNIYMAKQCKPASNKFGDILKEFFIINAPYYFNYLPYNHLAGVVFKVVNLQVTFLWSFTDVLTMCFSIYLISYFQDLNKFINNRQVSKTYKYSAKRIIWHLGDIDNNLCWERLRVHYSQMVEVVNQVNEMMSVLILQSYVTYIFYICTQLYHTLKTSEPKVNNCDDDIVDKIRQSPIYLTYYVYSFLFLIMRFVITSLLAANVSLVAKRPLLTLDNIPSSEYRLEVQRFRLQITYTPVAMSGQFFYVTRPMLLQVVGSIITYELVMLQLH